MAKEYRKIFIAPPGYVLIEADFSQIELRIAAIMAEEPTMLRLYRQGADIHAATAAAVMGISLKEFNDLPKDTRDHKRFQAKAARRMLVRSMSHVLRTCSMPWRSQAFRIILDGISGNLAVRLRMAHKHIQLKRNGVKTRFGSGGLHPRYRDDAALLRELAQHPLKSLVLTQRIEQRDRSRRYCEAFCSKCKNVQWILVDSILSGKTKNCKCQRHRKYPIGSPAKTLGQRYDAMVQRCERDTHVSSHHYKGRGIKVQFRSRQHFVLWALKKWPGETFKGKDFDRINNNGHYHPFNLRLVRRSTNLLNRRKRTS